MQIDSKQTIAIFKQLLSVVLVFSLAHPALSQKIMPNTTLIINTYNKQGMPEKAAEYIQNNDIDPSESNQLKFAIAKNYYLLNDYKQAANLFAEINKADAKKANYELAQCYARFDKPDLAVKYLRIHLESKDRLLQNTIKSDEAFAKIKSSVEWVTLWQTEWFSKYDQMLEDAWMEYENQNYEDALRTLNHLNSMRKSMVEAYYLKALVYKKLGEPSNALIAINEVLAKQPADARYLALKADIENQLNKPKKAIQTIELAIKADSSDIDYYFIRAQIYLKSNKIDLASNDLEMLMALVSDYEVYKLSAEIYVEAGEYQSALKAYNKCIDIQKYNPNLYIARANVFAKIMAYELAENDYTMALDFTPLDGELYYKRGMVRKQQYKTDLACQDFHKAFDCHYMKADAELRGLCQDR